MGDVRANVGKERNERGKKEYRGKGKEMKKGGIKATGAQGGNKKRMGEGRRQKKSEKINNTEKKKEEVSPGHVKE